MRKSCAQFVSSRPFQQSTLYCDAIFRMVSTKMVSVMVPVAHSFIPILSGIFCFRVFYFLYFYRFCLVFVFVFVFMLSFELYFEDQVVPEWQLHVLRMQYYWAWLRPDRFIM